MVIASIAEGDVRDLRQFSDRRARAMYIGVWLHRFDMSVQLLRLPFVTNAHFVEDINECC